MRRILVVLGGLVMLLVPASAPVGALAVPDPPRYKTYVVCSAKKSAPAATECGARKPTTAIFVSKDEDVTYKICVKFPGKPDKLCANHQQADKGDKKGNSITTNKPGEHKVTWYVDGGKVGTYRFDVVD